MVFSQMNRLALGESVHRPMLPWIGGGEVAWDERNKVLSQALAWETPQTPPRVST